MPVIELRSRQSVPTHAFQAGDEVRVYDAVREAVGNFARGRGDCYLIQELAGPFGRADFVLALPTQPALEGRIEVGLRPLRVMAEARLVAALSGHHARTIDEVATRGGMTSSAATRTARSLAGSGHVSILPNGRVRRHPALRPVVHTAAYEAKLKEWQSALRQARHYSLWNRWSTVVLETARNRSALVEGAKRHGVGVVVARKRIIAARIQRVPGYLELMASETLLDATNMLGTCGGNSSEGSHR